MLHLARNASESPSAYIERAEAALNAAFNITPGGGTPAMKAIDASLRRHPGQAVLRYFLGDGVPNGGDYACRQI